MNKLYKRSGRSFVMAVREAHRSYRTRQALYHTLSAASPGGQSPPSSPYAAVTTTPGANPFKFDEANPPAFAPPGTTPAVEPCPSAGGGSSRQPSSSSFFARSPTQGSPRSSAVTSRRRRSRGGGGTDGTGGGRVLATTTGGGGALSHHGSADVDGAPGFSSTTRSRRARASEGTGSPDPQASAVRSNGFPFYGGVNGGGGTYQAVSHAAGSSKRSRRWSTPWGKLSLSGSGSGIGSSSGGSSSSRGRASYSLPPSPAQDGGGGDGSYPSPTHPRLRARGGRTTPRARLRVRWGRLLAASLALVCGLVVVVAVVVVPGTRAGVRSGLATAASRLRLFVFGQGLEGGGIQAWFLGQLRGESPDQDGDDDAGMLAGAVGSG